MTVHEVIAQFDQHLAALSVQLRTALERGRREIIRSRINDFLDERLNLMRMRDSGERVHIIVLTVAL